MDHKALARKYRPKNFAEFIGQQHVVKALTNALTEQRLHHAYLLSGTRGVGKTTLGRILAKCLNCEQGITATPCDQCAACTDIDRGQSVDLIEIDAASNTKVEDTRDILDNVQYRPSRDRFKVYLIDEVHMLSKHSFNALLKTLEEPPEHVKFILATTDPQKLPVTILSRCLQFHLKNMSEQQISSHLLTITKKEKIAAEETALQQLAIAANGSMRDALSLLDQAIAYSENSVTQQAVEEMLGLINNDYIVSLVQNLSVNAGEKILSIINEIATNGNSFIEVCNALLNYFQQIALAQVIDNVITDKQILQFAKDINPETVQLYYQITLIGKRDLPLAPSEQTGFEMLMLRLLAFQPTTEQPIKQAIAKAKPARTTHSKKQETQTVEKPEATVETTAHSPNSPRPAIIIDEDEDDWHKTVKQLKLTGVTAALALHCALKQQTEEKIILQVDPSHAAMANDKLCQRLRQAIQEHYGKDLQVDIEIDKPINESIVAKQQRQSDEKQAQANQAILADPNAQDIMATFGAELIEESITSK